MQGANMHDARKDEDSGRPEIPPDIIFSVLVRLPAKSLMRFKAVCKAWHALIRDPCFAESHYTHSQTRPDASYLLFHLIGNYYSVDQNAILPANLDGVFSTQLPVETFDYNHTLVRRKACSNIVNSLICFWDEEWPRLQLLNLTTGEKIVLPVVEEMSHVRHACHPYYVLGFEPISKQYKVLFVCPQNWIEIEMCFVITVGGNNSWRRVAEVPEYLLSTANISANGCIYWEDELFVNGGRLGQDYKFVAKFRLFSNTERVVQYFDIAEEKFKLLSVHNQVGNETIHHEFITEIGGDFTFGGWNDDCSEITLWTLKNKLDQVWDKAKIVLPTGLYNSAGNVSGLGGTNTGKAVVILRPWAPEDYHDGGTLVICDLQTKKEYKTVELQWDCLSSKLPFTLHPLIGYRVSASHHVENIFPLNIPCM